MNHGKSAVPSVIRPHRTLRRLTVMAMLLVLTSCNGVFQGGPTFNTGLLVPISPPSADIPSTCKVLLNGDPTAQETVIERNNCVYFFMAMIDQAYYKYQASLFQAVNSGNAASDIVSLGLTSAATLAGGATAKSILSAIATGVNGAKGKIDADVLYNKSVELILTQMDADRADWKSRILNQIKNDNDYNIYAASADLLSYYQAGTWTHAVLALQAKAGTLLTSCQQNVKDQQLNTGQLSPGCQPQPITPAVVLPAPKLGGAARPSLPPVALATPVPQAAPPPVQGHAVTPVGVSNTAAANALRQFFEDPNVSQQQRVSRMKQIEDTAKQLGYDTSPAVASWVRNPDLIDQQANVAKSLQLVPP